ncbi:hypothetical protein [Mycobacterium sp. IS-1590]|uniref:hypothetical protein n=1 Tax=Mycobacterium sp. IS-1590 TaxID=1772286 RepID=UPI000ADFEA45|nr:hypothetical protein [Mycobacterium sp. IS-1590]
MTDQLSQRRRAWLASRRMPPLEPCGCIRHPEVDRHRCGNAISDKQAEAAAAAIEHLDEMGTPGLLDRDTCRAMWRIGSRDRAVEVDARTQGLVA